MTDCKFVLGEKSDSSIQELKYDSKLSIPPPDPINYRKSNDFAHCQPVGVFYFGNSTRFLILALATVCLSLIVSNSLALNFTIICMTTDMEPNSHNLQESQLNITYDTVNTTLTFSDLINREDNIETGKTLYYYTHSQKSLLFSAIAVGTLLGTVPITFLTTKFGVRNTFTAYGLLSAFATLLTPFSAWLGFFPLFSLLSCHLQFGPIFTMPVSGELCRSQFGWPAVYFLQGIMTLIAFAGFYLFYRDSPQIHNHKELDKIQKGRNSENEKDAKKVPYKAILTDLSVWGVIVMNIGGQFGFQIFVQYGPIYLNKVLKYDIQNTGFAAALPYVLSVVIKVIVGPFSDYFTFISLKSRVLFFATLSQFLMAACFISMYFIPIEYPTLIQSSFTLCIVASGINCVGVGKSAQLISGQYAHVMLALCSLVGNFVILILPLVVHLMAPNNKSSEWAQIFISIAIIGIITTIFFDCTAEVDARPWTYNNSFNGAKQSFNDKNLTKNSNDVKFEI